MSDSPATTPDPTPSTTAKAGDLGAALATWIYMVDDGGHRPADTGLVAACDALRSGTADNADALGQALVDAVAKSLGTDHSAAAVRAWLNAQLGDTRVGSIEGESRDDRTRQMRAYQFRTSMPFVALIIDRFPDGSVGPHWVMVERVTDQVTCMDPYPWDDLDEEYSQPLVEFMVKWELAGCEALTFLA